MQQLHILIAYTSLVATVVPGVLFMWIVQWLTLQSIIYKVSRYTTHINSIPTTRVATTHSDYIDMSTCYCSHRDVVYVGCAVAYSTHL